MPVRGWIEVNPLFCKGCELCVAACPQEVLALDMDRLTPKGFHPVSLVKDGCTGCAICAVVCPDTALTVYREVPVRPARATVAAAEAAAQAGR